MKLNFENLDGKIESRNDRAKELKPGNVDGAKLKKRKKKKKKKDKLQKVTKRKPEAENVDDLLDFN